MYVIIRTKVETVIETQDCSVFNAICKSLRKRGAKYSVGYKADQKGKEQ